MNFSASSPLDSNFRIFKPQITQTFTMGLPRHVCFHAGTRNFDSVENTRARPYL